MPAGADFPAPADSATIGLTMAFDLHSPYSPEGDQPQAIEQLVEGLERGEHYQTLLGVTGSGKSLAWDEPVLIRTRLADGSFETRLRPIGPFVDKALEFGALVQLNGDGTEFAPPPQEV